MIAVSYWWGWFWDDGGDRAWRLRPIAVQKIYREGLEIRMIRTSPVSPVKRNERRMAIARMMAVGDAYPT
ncbi:MAG: hypothetical protein NT070_03745 [Cyanobacteria bacterium]|nr:hypothetical protein [Cyanobacteriota bacterium]